MLNKGSIIEKKPSKLINVSQLSYLMSLSIACKNLGVNKVT